MPPIGRNDECTCGSKQKYKHCCLKLEQGRPERQEWLQHPHSLQDKNLILLNAAIDIFGLKRDWDVVKRKITPAQVNEFYEFVAALWPLSTDLTSILPQPDSSLRALYLGEYAPEIIVKNVCRFGLYADHILLINPFENPNNIAEEYNPIVHPEKWIDDTLKSLLQLIAMAPWVIAGFVTFMPNPGDFDRQLLLSTMKLAEARTKDKPVTERDIDDSIMKQHLMRKLLSSPPHYIKRIYKEMEPNATDEQVANLLQHVEEQRMSDPFSTGQTMDNMPGQMMTMRTGVSLEMGMYICQATGAFPYTNFRYRWEEILGAREQFDSGAQTWTPLTKAFQNLDFKFLDHVTPDFAYAMRKEGRLGGFRKYLREVWKAAEGSPDPAKTNTLARDFSDGLQQSYQEAKSDWDDIDADLLKWVGGGGVAAGLTAGVQSAFSSGKFSLELPAAGFVLNGVAQLVSSRMKRRNFRRNVPMSVFVDLDRQTKRLQ